MLFHGLVFPQRFNAYVLNIGWCNNSREQNFRPIHWIKMRPTFNIILSCLKHISTAVLVNPLSLDDVLVCKALSQPTRRVASYTTRGQT